MSHPFDGDVVGDTSGARRDDISFRDRGPLFLSVNQKCPKQAIRISVRGITCFSMVTRVLGSTKIDLQALMLMRKL